MPAKIVPTAERPTDASAGLLGVVWAVIHGNDRGWFDPQILAGFVVGGALLLGFVAW